MPKVILFIENFLLILFFACIEKSATLPAVFTSVFMRRICEIFSILFCTVVLSVSCKTAYQPQSVTYVDYHLTQNGKQNDDLAKLLQPYSDSINKSMNAVVAVSETELVKNQPEGTLGNILADAMLAKAKQSYKVNIDAAFINYGGIRLNAIPAGDITRGKIFELSPFDNIIVLQKLNGKILQAFLNHISNKGGWPVSGMQWQIKNKAAVNVLINGKPIDETAIYTVALADYVANGGDDCIMLKPVPQINNGYLFRDAILEYFADINQQGKKIVAKIENRVSNAE
jgi:2',3'-cyclic-nucleotide 2'-phosphodiesterase (5'-nucleotidase family)